MQLHARTDRAKLAKGSLSASYGSSLDRFLIAYLNKCLLQGSYAVGYQLFDEESQQSAPSPMLNAESTQESCTDATTDTVR